MTLQQHLVDIVERAVKTFVEAFLSALAITNISGSKAALVSAVAAGISAVWTLAVKAEQNAKGNVVDELFSQLWNALSNPPKPATQSQPPLNGVDQLTQPQPPVDNPPASTEPPTPPIGSTV